MENIVDVVVIGGGIHGVSAAFHLVSQGVDVQLFERDAAGSGPTGRSSAVCRAYYTNEFLARVANESLEFFRTFAERTGGRDAGHRAGGMMFLHPAEDLDDVLRTTGTLNAIGTEVHIVTGDELTQRCAAFNLDDVGFGVWEVHAGHADPWATCQAMYARAVELGLRPRLYTPAVTIEARSGGGAVVIAADGSRTACSRLLIAAGPWTRGLVLQLGVDLPLTVERHAVATYAWAQAAPLPFAYADLPAGIYVRDEGSELFICGSLSPASQANPDRFNASIEHGEIADMSSKLQHRVPQLADAESRGGWASLYDVSPDWQPVIGEIADGIFVDAGTSGHGFKLGPAMGRQVAQLVMGTPEPGLAQFHPERFAIHRELAAGFGSSKLLG